MPPTEHFAWIKRYSRRDKAMEVVEALRAAGIPAALHDTGESGPARFQALTHRKNFTRALSVAAATIGATSETS